MNGKTANTIDTKKLASLIQTYGIVLVLIIMIIVISILNPRFLGVTNLFNVLSQTAIYGILALGMTFVITSQGIDLSVGSVLALAGCVAASFAQVSGASQKYFPNMGQMPLIVPILLCLLVGSLSGALNGWLIAATKIPPFIATLGMHTVARGLVLVYTGGIPISNLLPAFDSIGQGKIFGYIPVAVLVYIFMILISWVLLHNTKFGKAVYALGGNKRAAEISGVNVSRTLIIIYAYCGLLASVAAIVYAGRAGSMHPSAATGYELTAVAATTVGGTSHTGGIGTIWGAVIGALLISVLRNGLTLLSVSSYWQQIAEGVIIVAAVIVDMRKNRGKK
ncbi:ABC transporter permease [Treponema phagedenis]|uniref:ABC transporter permease n=1 Tax=Treponema phagedenis TaxID=162 RepID=A0A0B7GSW4_TREPH|nr:ABC transporter permease [Treponema phagedenis]NVP23071.1 ABC transporter permease [Treponema phagedenis]QEJ95044.1 ABC transporter permease [Treponema phagedenis]QEJ98128.1 ABC transporter permease [Treponema phagedenis]QEK00969.1 ABC transporter permease [Treponema phagedenis]QEK03636.1 ABC transporter permease [Treponema phagedenis]